MLVRGGAGKDVLKGGNADDILYGFGGHDTLTGGGGDDVLAGHDDNDSLSGGVGDDYLLGGMGADTIDGGAGVDWAAYEDALSAVKIDLRLTTAQNTLGAGIDRLVNVENLYGSAFNDELIGSAGVNFLHGGSGHDTISGGDGDDHIDGGRGSDRIDGGAGIDTISFDDGGFEEGVAVFLQGFASTSQRAGEVDFMTGIENVYATVYNDTLQGDLRDNYLMGREGDDWLVGGNAASHSNGVDVLDGGAGNDTFRLVLGDVTMLGGEGVDLIDLGAHYFQSPTVMLDLASEERQVMDEFIQITLSSVENVTGTDLRIGASDAANVFTLAGNYSRVIFRSVGEIGKGDGADRIVADRVVVDVSAIDADVTTAGDQAFRYVEAFTGAAGEMTSTVDQATRTTKFQFDVDGDAVSDADLLISGWYVGPPANFVL